MASRVNKAWRITIDRSLRDDLGVRPGMIAYQRVVDGHVEVTFLPAPHRRSLYGALHREGQEPRVTTAEDLEKAVMEAVAGEQDKVRD